MKRGFSDPLKTTVGVGVAALGGVLMTTVHPLAPVAVAVFVLCAAIVASSALHLLLAFVAVLFLRPAEFFPALEPLKLGKLAALAALGMWILGKLLRREAWVARSTHNLWMILLAGAIFASSMLGTWPSASLEYFKDVFFKIVLLYLLILNLVDTPERGVKLQVAVAVMTAVLGGYGLYVKLTGQAQVEGTRAGAVGLLGDPNDLAFTLLMAAPFLLLAVFQTRGWTRRCMVVLAVLTVGGIIATQSRGGFLGLAAGAYLLVRDRLRSRLATGVVIAAAVLGLFAAGGVGSRQGLEEEGMDESAEGRLNAWRAGMRMFRDHPLLGVGFERFADNFVIYSDDPGDRGGMAAHNTFVNALAETGLAGTVPFVVLVVLTLWIAWRTSIRAREWEPGLEKAVVQAQVANFGAILVSGFFLSQTWNWFFYIAFAQAAATKRIYGIDRELVRVAWRRPIARARGPGGPESARRARHSGPLEPAGPGEPAGPLEPAGPGETPWA